MSGLALPTLIFASLSLLAAGITASESLTAWLVLDSERLQAGQIWRLWTGHLCHITWSQWLADAPVFAVVYIGVAYTSGLRTAVILSLITALLVSLSIVYFSHFQIYAGLSGLSCAAISFLLCSALKDIDHPILVLLCMTGFIYYLGDGNIRFIGGFPIASQAHSIGAISGTVCWLVTQFPPRTKC